MIPNKETHVAVLGAAMAGSLVALEFLEQLNMLEKAEGEGQQKTVIHLFDQNESVLGKISTSSNQCFKLHSGMHYLNNLETAKKCLKASIEFAKKHPDCLFQKSNPLRMLGDKDKYQDRRPGRYMIVEGGAVDMEDRVEKDGKTTKGARYIAEELRQCYKALIAEDPDNEVFGPWDQFIVEAPSLNSYEFAPETIEYSKDGVKVEERAIKGMFVVREAQIDIDKLRTKLTALLNKYIAIGRLVPHYSTKVESINLDPNVHSLGYEIEATNLKDASKLEPVCVKAVANCTWKDMLDIEQGLADMNMSLNENSGMDVRGKLSVLVKLPAGYENYETVTFASGPYATITMTNLETREAVLTFSPKSDLEPYSAGQEKKPDWVQTLTPETLTINTVNPKTNQSYAQEIVKGCAGFLPKDKRTKFIEEVEVLELRLAHVCSKKADIHSYDLEDANSPIHKRLESGIEERLLGIVRYACIKMTYGPQAAGEVTKILMQHLKQINKIEQNFKNHHVLSDNEVTQETKIKTNRKIRKHLNRFIQAIQEEKDDEELKKLIQPVLKEFMPTSPKTVLTSSSVSSSDASRRASDRSDGSQEHTNLSVNNSPSVSTVKQRSELAPRQEPESDTPLLMRSNAGQRYSWMYPIKAISSAVSSAVSRAKTLCLGSNN